MKTGYGQLAPEAFVGFRAELDAGAWRSVKASSREAASPASGSALGYWKFLLAAGIDDVVTAGTAANEASALDPAWDQAERRLVYAVQYRTLDPDPKVAAAALRVQEHLCPDGGTGMTALGYDDEVDFARKQLSYAASPALAKDVKLLKLEPELDAIRRATDDLAKALGRDGEAPADRAPRSKRIERAARACGAAFAHVHQGLALALTRANDDAQRRELSALMAPLERLLERRPAAADAGDAGGEGDAPADRKPVLDPTG